MKYISKSEQQTIACAVKFAHSLKGGDIVFLQGDLGAGKTTFVKGLAQGLKADPQNVNSPTFVLMNHYEGKLPLYHFDLYRLEHVHEISSIGYEEFLYGDGVAVIEWAERLGELAPREYLRIELAHKAESERSIKLSAVGERYCQIISRFQGIHRNSWKFTRLRS